MANQLICHVMYPYMCVCVCVCVCVVSEWGLFFHIVPVHSTHFIYQCCSAWILLVSKVINSRYELFSRPSCIYIYIYIYIYNSQRRCPWCNGYHRRKWTRQHEFKSWTRLIAFHIALILLGKVWIQLFSLQLWVNSRED